MTNIEKNKIRAELESYAEDYTFGFCGQRDENAIFLFMTGVEATLEAISANKY